MNFGNGSVDNPALYVAEEHTTVNPVNGSRTPHHLRAKGMGGKGVKAEEVGNLVGLCRVCHSLIHVRSLDWVNNRFNVDLEEVARKLGEKWVEEESSEMTNLFG